MTTSASSSLGAGPNSTMAADPVPTSPVWASPGTYMTRIQLLVNR